MIKLIIFDLDGVLLDAKKLHFESLNKALGVNYAIGYEEHLIKYDGLKTNEKLIILSREKNLPENLHEKIWHDKQIHTLSALENLNPSSQLIECMKKLKQDNYLLAVCSNSIRKTIFVSLAKLGIIEYFDLILSNEDVKNSKPHPEIFWKAMSILKCLPEETCILEDSPNGLSAAYRSTNNVLRVKNIEETNYNNINKFLNKKFDDKYPVWEDEKLNILIPMAGAGSRFESAGYSFPKPLIDVKGKPMIQLVVENLNLKGNFIFVVQKKHREKYNLDFLLNVIAPDCKIVEVDGITEGAACTTLLAKEYIDNDDPLVFANSDQFVDWNSNEFMYKMNETDSDGGILTFTNTHPKWSYVKIDSSENVIEVAEKKPISNIATVGIYYWKRGSDYVKYAEQMINKDIRVNNEFYVCPVFNQAIEDGKKIKIFNANNMWGLGTPEDLEYFIKNSDQ
jgi:HAD superfamily hydrolase (TIGR01509 family)